MCFPGAIPGPTAGGNPTTVESFNFRMDSASSTEPPPLPPQPPLAHLVGTLVALLTLVLPLGAIAYFSSVPLSTPGEELPWVDPPLP